MATSNAMGTGRKAGINATATIPMTLTCPVSAGCGMSSAAKAPGTAAKIISGNARRKTIQILFGSVPPPSRPPQVSGAGTSMMQLTSGSGAPSRGAAAGTKTRIRNSTVANFNKASDRQCSQQRVPIARFGAAPLQRGDESQGSGSKEKREKRKEKRERHADPVRVEPIDRGSPNPVQVPKLRAPVAFTWLPAWYRFSAG
jgi:hypothetical protein